MPSLTGKEDDEMEGDQLMFDLDQGFAQGFTQEQVEGMFYFSTSSFPDYTPLWQFKNTHLIFPYKKRVR